VRDPEKSGHQEIPVNMAEIILHTIPYQQLPEKVKEKVIVTFRGWVNNVYKVLLRNKQIGEMFDQLNITIEFYKDSKGRKLFRIDDSDERMAKFLGDQFAIAAKWDPNIMDKVLLNMIKRNDDEPRLKVV
jgi:hypothetical protein